MIRLSMSELTTYRWSFEEDLLSYKDAGFDGVGLWLRKILDYGEDRAVELVTESGLEVANVSWVGGFTGDDAASSQENLVTAQKAIDLCSELGAESLTVYTGGRNGHTSRHANRLLCGALDRLIPHAERMGVALAMEPMHSTCAADWTVLTSLERTLRLVQDYDTSALRIALDSYHFPIGEADAALMRELVPHLAVVHLGDFVEPRGVDHARVPLGEGDAPLGGFVRGLVEAGYEGFFDVKLLGPDIETVDYHELLKNSHTALTGLAEFPLSADFTTNDSTPSRPDECNATW